MLRDDRSARAHAVRVSFRTARRTRRPWRRRSRRAQVSAVATVLGLLLVVTFIANYITTTLPNTMGQNDLQHDVLVQDQVAEFSALLQATAQHQAVGAQVSQALNLGSASAPPFAAADSSWVSAGNMSGGLKTNFTLVGTHSVVVFPGAGSPLNATFVVHLLNTYEPAAEVAYDQGAVVYAQPGGVPIFVAPPPISLSNGVLTVFQPRFVNPIGSEAGVGTADMSARLLSAQQLVVPGRGYSFQSGSTITIKIATPYAAVWYATFQSSVGLAPYVNCAGAGNVCSPNTLYSPGGPLGTVTLNIPTTGLELKILTALYSVTLA